jgi:amino acid adenylation domain-containing protein
MSDKIDSSNLTSSQFQIWTGQKLNPDLPLYNMALAFYIQGELKPDAFRDAFHTLISRSDALRVVINEQDGIPRQSVREKVPQEIEFIDLSHDPDSRNTVQSRLEKRASLPFDLREQLFDSILIKLAEEKYIWYLNQHHLITDGWSSTLVYRRMTEFYQLALEDRLADAPELPSYLDYQAYEHTFRNSDAYRNASAYWQNRSVAPGVPIDLYGNTPSVQSTRSSRVFCDIGRDRSEKLNKLAQEKNFRSFSIHLSLFNIFSALLFAYLYRISGNSSLVIGTPAHNRPTAAFQETIGLFIEMFPLGINIAPGETFRSLVKAITPASHDFLRYAHPGTSNAVSRNAYSVTLNYINVSFPDFCGMPMRSTWIHPGHADMGHALQLQVHDFDSSGSFHLHFDFSCQVFDKDLREKAVGHFLRLLDTLLENPDKPIADVDLLGEDERRVLVDSYNDTDSPLHENQTVIELLKQQAAATPHAIAISDNGRELTYRELDVCSDRMARQLQERGVGPEVMVGVFMERSGHLIAALLSVLKAGAAFVPIDSSFPEERISYLLEDCGAPFILTQNSLENRLPQGKTDIISLDHIFNQQSGDHQPLEESRVNRGSLAYVIYTSGSTGQPKGVMIEHASLFNYLFWAKKMYMHDGPHDFPLFSSVAADLTITSIFLPLISGSKVVVYRESRDGVDLSILDVFKDDAVDIIKLTPSHLALLEENNAPAGRLKKFIVGGEDFKTGLAQRVSRFFDRNVEIYNEYGPTEATVGCMIYLFDPAHDNNTSVAIGEPIDNLQVYLLDDGMKPVPVGMKGNMYIAGTGLARGYLNQPELTADRFINNPFRHGEKMYSSGDVGRWRSAGVMEFLGRKDHQVKVRGFRIELGEIEAALLQYPGIRECCMQIEDYQFDMLQETGYDPEEKTYSTTDRRINAYYVGDSEYSSEEMRFFLLRTLPAYMIPAHFIRLESFPLNATGKVDRSALPLPDTSRTGAAGEYEAPRNDVEKLLAEIWAKVLGVDPVGIHDNFFDLGGDSILNIQITTRAAKAGLEFTPGLLFQHPSVAELAANIEAGREQGLANGTVPLTPVQQWFFAFDLPEPHIWNMSQNLDVSREITPDILEKAFQNLLLHHDSLRLRFLQKASGWEQTLRDADNSFTLEYYNLSDLPESERRKSIDRSMQKAHSSLNLQNGPLLRALYFDRGGDHSCLLGVIIHHLAVDALSWYIILEDLETLCRDISDGKPPLLPQKTTPFTQWAERLEQYANSPACESESAFWIGQGDTDVSPLPRDVNLPGNGQESSARFIVGKLEHQHTHDLLHKVNLSSRISVDEMLLAALMQTLCNWSGSSAVRVDKEGHGREGVIDDVTVYRTLGWFTSIYPLYLALPVEQGAGVI